MQYKYVFKYPVSDENFQKIKIYNKQTAGQLKMLG